MLEDRIATARHPSSCAPQNNHLACKIFCPHFEPSCTRVHLGPGGSSRRTRTRCTRWPTWRRSSATVPAAAWLKRPRDTPFLFPPEGSVWWNLELRCVMHFNFKISHICRRQNMSGPINWVSMKYWVFKVYSYCSSMAKFWAITFSILQIYYYGIFWAAQCP